MKTDTQTNWTQAFNAFQSHASALRKRTDALIRSIQDRAWRKAASVEIPRDGCCLHNASIDDNLRGWCAGNPERLRVAKAASVQMEHAWKINRLFERLYAILWNRYLNPCGAPKSPIPAFPEINRHILFSK